MVGSGRRHQCARAPLRVHLGRTSGCYWNYRTTDQRPSAGAESCAGGGEYDQVCRQPSRDRAGNRRIRRGKQANLSGGVYLSRSRPQGPGPGTTARLCALVQLHLQKGPHPARGLQQHQRLGDVPVSGAGSRRTAAHESGGRQFRRRAKCAGGGIHRPASAATVVHRQ